MSRCVITGRTADPAGHFVSSSETLCASTVSRGGWNVFAIHWHPVARVPSFRLYCRSWGHRSSESVCCFFDLCSPPPTLVNSAAIVSGTVLCATLYRKHAKSSNSLFSTLSRLNCRRNVLTDSYFSLIVKDYSRSKVYLLWSRLTSVRLMPLDTTEQ